MSLLFKFFALVLGVSLATILLTAPYLNKLEEVKRTSEVKINEQIIVAEVVSKAKERERGLSGRDSLGINEGMLFLFEEPGLHSFWMKGMKFPIDIIWISGNEIVGVEEGVSPESGVPDAELKIYRPPGPVNKVLEVKAGRAESLRAGVDTQVKIRPLIKTNN